MQDNCLSHMCDQGRDLTWTNRVTVSATARPHLDYTLDKVDISVGSNLLHISYAQPSFEEEKIAWLFTDFCVGNIEPALCRNTIHSVGARNWRAPVHACIHFTPLEITSASVSLYRRPPPCLFIHLYWHESIRWSTE